MDLCSAHAPSESVERVDTQETGRQSRPHTWRGGLQRRSTNKGASGMKKEKDLKNV